MTGIRTASGEELVVLPRVDCEAHLAAADDAEGDADDIVLYGARNAEIAPVEGFTPPPAVSTRPLRGNGLLKALRLSR